MVTKGKEVAIRKIVKRPAGTLQLNIPKKEVAEPLGLKGNERVKIFLNEKRRQWTYQVLD